MLDQIKSWFKSSGINSGIASLLALLLGGAGFIVTGGQITELMTLVPMVVANIGLIVSRMAQTTSGLDLKGWVLLVVGLFSGGVSASGVDPEIAKSVVEGVTAIVAILFTILQANGIQWATAKIGKEK